MARTHDVITNCFLIYVSNSIKVTFIRPLLNGKYIDIYGICATISSCFVSDTSITKVQRDPFDKCITKSVCIRSNTRHNIHPINDEYTLSRLIVTAILLRHSEGYYAINRSWILIVVLFSLLCYITIVH